MDEHFGLIMKSNQQGYAFIEYPTLAEARAAIDGAHDTKLLDQTINVDFAFVRPPPNAGGANKGGARGGGGGARGGGGGRRNNRSRSRSPGAGRDRDRDRDRDDRDGKEEVVEDDDI